MSVNHDLSYVVVASLLTVDSLGWEVESSPALTDNSKMKSGPIDRINVDVHLGGGVDAC